MSSISQRLLWIGLTIAVILGIVWQFAPLPDAKERMSRLPLLGLGYKGHDLPLKPYESKFLNDVNVIKRMYTVDGQKFFITILDGTRNRHVVHDPYFCFKGSGWAIVNEQELPIKKGNANLLVISKDNQTREALFWFSDGKTQYSSPMQYWLQATLRRLTLGMSGSEPILIVVQPIQNDTVFWNRFEKQFTSLFEL